MIFSNLVRSLCKFRSHLVLPGFPKKFVEPPLSLFLHAFLEPPGVTRLLKTVFRGFQSELGISCVCSGLLVRPGFPKQYSPATGLSLHPHVIFFGPPGATRLPTAVFGGHQKSQSLVLVLVMVRVMVRVRCLRVRCYSKTRSSGVSIATCNGR